MSIEVVRELIRVAKGSQKVKKLKSPPPSTRRVFSVVSVISEEFKVMLSCRIHWDRSRTNLFSLACISFSSFCRFCVKKYLKVSKWDFPTSRRWLLHTRSMEKMRLSLPICKYDDLVLVSARNSVYVCYVSNRAQVCIIVKCALVSSIRMKNHKSHQGIISSGIFSIRFDSLLPRFFCCYFAMFAFLGISRLLMDINRRHRFFLDEIENFRTFLSLFFRLFTIEHLRAPSRVASSR